MIYNIIRQQKKTNDPIRTKTELVYMVTGYLLFDNNFNDLLRPLGQLLITYRVVISKNDLAPLKINISKNDVLTQLAKVILNTDGYDKNLLALLKTLITYAKTDKNK